MKVIAMAAFTLPLASAFAYWLGLLTAKGALLFDLSALVIFEVPRWQARVLLGRLPITRPFPT
jgi:hypothetical protein